VFVDAVAVDVETTREDYPVATTRSPQPAEQARTVAHKSQIGLGPQEKGSHAEIFGPEYLNFRSNCI
jgi:hypothetical protein